MLAAESGDRLLQLELVGPLLFYTRLEFSSGEIEVTGFEGRFV